MGVFSLCGVGLLSSIGDSSEIFNTVDNKVLGRRIPQISDWRMVNGILHFGMYFLGTGRICFSSWATF